MFEGIRGALERIFKVAPAVGEESSTFAERLPLVPGPAPVVTLASGVIVAMNREMAFGIIERLLGSAEPGPTPERAPSELEWDLLVGVLGEVRSRSVDPSVPALPPSQRVKVETASIGAARLLVVTPVAEAGVDVVAGFACEAAPDEIRPGAVIELGTALLRLPDGRELPVAIGSWRGKAAVRVLSH
jgi:hypothetical protein